MVRIASILPAPFTFQPAPEVWRLIPSCAGYSASSEGRIRNDRTGRLVKPSRRRDGYYHFGAAGRQILAHRAVAEAFLGPCPERQEVDHHNGNKGDNRQLNLSYCTHRTNLQRAAARGQLARGDRNPNTRLTETAAREIRDAVLAPGDLTRLARKYGVTVTAVRAVRSGLTWAWVS